MYFIYVSIYIAGINNIVIIICIQYIGYI